MGLREKSKWNVRIKFIEKLSMKAKKQGRYYIIIDNFISAHVLSRWEFGATNFIIILVISLNLYDDLY